MLSLVRLWESGTESGTLGSPYVFHSTYLRILLFHTVCERRYRLISKRKVFTHGGIMELFSCHLPALK